MKQSGMWMWFCLKRLLYRPLFLITLLLLPLLVMGMRMEMKKSHAIVKVGVLCEDDTDREAADLAKELVDLSNTAVLFAQYKDEEVLRRDVVRGEIQAGYIVPGGLREKLAETAVSDKPVIRTIRREGEMTLKIVDELVLCRVYEYMAYDIAADFIAKRSGEPVQASLREAYDVYRQSEMPFAFQYENGEENRVLSDGESDYLLLPVQGMIAVLVLLSAMSGAVFWYGDGKRNVFVWLPPRRQNLVHLIYILMPTLCAGVVGFLSLCITGLYGATAGAFFLMLWYVAAVTIFVYIIQMFLRRETWFLAAIPIVTVGELLVCPVFIDMGRSLPALKYLRMLGPVNFYMESVYSVQGRLSFLWYFIGSMFLAGIVSFTCKSSRFLR